MAVGDESREGQSGKGFSGLSSMVSDVDAAVANAEKASRAAVDTSGAAGQGETAPQQRQPTDAPQPRSEAYQQPSSQPSSFGGPSAGKWLLGIGAVIGVIWVLSESGNKSTPPSPTYTPSPQPPVTSSPAPSWQPPPAAPRPQTPSRPSEEKPPVGTDLVLSIPQIRYCVAEDIRLDAAKGVINNYVETDVDRFNAMVADYNSRCSRFRYRRGALESARSDVEAIRSLLQAEGRSRFVRRPNLGSQQRPAEGASPSFDGVVLAIQRRLNALGYDAGVPDGFVGPKTRAAIASFQRNQNIAVNGTPSSELLERIVSATDKQVPSSPKITEPRDVPSLRPTEPSTGRPQMSPGKPDLSGVSLAEREAIERTCNYDRQYSGPAAYYACISRELRNLSSFSGKPDMSKASASEQQAIERTCNYDRQYSGPAAYYACVSRELRSLSSFNGKPDMGRASPAEREAIEKTCNYDRQYSGPAAYYSCVLRELRQLAVR